MTTAQLIGLLVALTTLIASAAAGTKFLVKHYFSELKPNSGSSMRDELHRQGNLIIQINSRVDELYRHLIERD